MFEKNSSSKSEISSGCSRADNSYNYEMQLKDHSDNDHDNVMVIVMMIMILIAMNAMIITMMIIYCNDIKEDDKSFYTRYY